MPPTQKKPRRTNRCEYAEDGRRCVRDGDGIPVLCNPHKIALGDAARRAQNGGGRQAGDGVFNLFDRLFSGKKLNRKVINDALDDAADIAARVTAANARAAQRPPDAPPENIYDHIRSAAQERQERRQQEPPPRQDPKDPRSRERVEARKKARITLGLSMNEALSLDGISSRRKVLARKHHPDRPGGSVTKMQAINAAADELEAGVRAGVTVG